MLPPPPPGAPPAGDAPPVPPPPGGYSGYGAAPDPAVQAASSGWGVAPAGPPIDDPHAVGMAAGRLGSAGRRSGRVSLTVTAALLEPEEMVECAVQGRFNGADGVAVLTSERVLVVNDRTWKPDVLEIEVDGSTTVQGWQDDRTAALVFQRGDQSATIDRIGDRHLAMEFAQRLRARAAG